MKMMDPFERIRYVKSIIQATFPKITHEEINTHIRNICKNQADPKIKIDEKEHAIIDILLKNNIRPGTVRTWYRVLILPAYLQEKIRQKEITLSEAIQLNLEANKPYKTLQEELRQDILTYVEQLAKKDFLRGDDYATI